MRTSSDKKPGPKNNGNRLYQQDEDILHWEISRDGGKIRMRAYESERGPITRRSSISISDSEIDIICRDVKGSLEEVRTMGQRLYDVMITNKIKDQLNQTKAPTLVLHIDDKLVHVPWELAFDGEQFLCRQFNIGRIVNVELEDSEVSMRIPRERMEMLILCNPRADLPASYTEGKRILTELEKNENLLVDLENNSIDVAFVIDHLRNYDIVHYAGHAYYDRANPGKSGWLLKDGKLTAESVIKLKNSKKPLPALVFSNGCQSSQTEKWDFGNIYGLANAFLLAGVRHYIGTLWEVYDEPSSEFAVIFYREVQKGSSIGEAVRKARLGTIEKFGEDMIVWASYVLYGYPMSRLFHVEDIEGLPTEELLKRGINLTKQENLGEALRYFEAAVEGAIASEGDENKELLSQIYRQIGELHIKSGNFAKAKRPLEDSLDYKRSPEGLNALALTHLKLGNLPEAERILEETLSVLNSSDDSSCKAQAFHYYGLVHQARKETAPAVENFDRAMSIYEKFTDGDAQSGLSRVYDSYANLYVSIGKLEAAITLYEKSKEIKERIGDLAGLAFTYGGLGRANLLMSNYSSAVEYFNRDMQIALSLNDRRAIAMIHNHLGKAYSLMGELKEAIRYYQRSFEIASSIDDIVSCAYTYLGLAETSLGEKNLSDAIDYCDRAAGIFNRPPEHYWGLAQTEIIYGMIHREREQWDLARRHFEQGIRICQEKEIPFDLIIALFELGIMYYVKKELDTALYYLSDAFRRADRLQVQWIVDKFATKLREMQEVGLLRTILWMVNLVPNEKVRRIIPEGEDYCHFSPKY